MFDKIEPLLKKLFKDYEGGPLEPHHQRRLLIIIGAVLAIILLLGIFTTDTTGAAFGKTAEGFAKATSDYNPQEAVKYTTGSARELVLSQAKKIGNAKAEGFQSRVDGVKTEILSQRNLFLSAQVTVYTTEQWPDRAPEKYSHTFIMEGQRVGSTWKISNLIEIEVKKI